MDTKKLAEDVLKAKGLWVDPVKPTQEQLILQSARKVWEQVKRNLAVPLLSGIQSSAQYSTTGTQQLLLKDFERKFSNWSKDELVFLCAVMHTEELEKQIKQEVDAGLIGEHRDKPI